MITKRADILKDIPESPRPFGIFYTIKVSMAS